MNHQYNELTAKQEKPWLSVVNNAEGKIGYIIAWLLGVPIWVLLIVFVIRG